MKKILVPIDHSACSDAAAGVAITLAHKAQAEIYFLHLYIDYGGHEHVPHGIEKLQVDRHRQNPTVGMIKDKLAKLVAKADALSVKASPLLIYHDGHERIEDYIKPYNIDLWSWVLMVCEVLKKQFWTPIHCVLFAGLRFLFWLSKNNPMILVYVKLCLSLLLKKIPSNPSNR